MKLTTHQRIDLVGITTEPVHCISHASKINNSRHASKILNVYHFHTSIWQHKSIIIFQKQNADLKQHSSRFERNFNQFGSSVLPINNLLNILSLNRKLIAVSNGRLEKYPNGVWEPFCQRNIHPTINIQPIIMQFQLTTLKPPTLFMQKQNRI